MRWSVVFLFLTLASVPSNPAKGVSTETLTADTVLLNAKIITLDDDRPEAQALAARGGFIVGVGSDEEIRPFIGGKTTVIDLQGKLAVPGFIEGHGHLLALGRSRMTLDLTTTRSWEQVVSLVQRTVGEARPGQWIVGAGWHQEKWDRAPAQTVEGYPTHDSLSRISPDNPVLLTHASGHASFANAKAMELAGITEHAEDPPGGKVLRDKDGRPIGVFLNEARRPLEAKREEDRSMLPQDQIEAEEEQALELATRECLSKGITSFQDAGSSLAAIDLFQKHAEAGRLGIRLWVMIREDDAVLEDQLSRYRIVNLGDYRLTVRAVKRFMDGALGSRSAWLLAPYADLPSSTGLNVEPIAQILRTARLAVREGFQMCVHAIGDRANREVLNLYEAVFRENPSKKDLRWRVEHAQHLSRTDIPRFGEAGVIASVQGVHCTSDGPWVIRRLGRQRAEEGAYVWRDLARSGAVVANGTDAPVEDVDPIACFYSTVTRRLPDGSPFYPDQALTRLEALRSYTVNNAYAAFEEDLKGSLTPGKLADVTVLSRDILTVPEDEILDARVLYTIVGGQIAYRKP